MSILKLALAATLLAPVATGASAQSVLPGGTPVPVALVEQISSKTARVGDRFAVRAAEDVRIGDTVVIPAGTMGAGEVTRVVRKGAFGRAGRIETRMLYIGSSNRQIVLNGSVEQRGRSGLLPTIAVGTVAGPFAGFVTGRSAEFPAGQRFAAYVSEIQPAVVTPG